MKNEALRIIKNSLTPAVTIQSCHDVSDGIIAEIRLDWLIPSKKPRLPRQWGKLIRARTDKEGNFTKLDGLL